MYLKQISLLLCLVFYCVSSVKVPLTILPQYDDSFDSLPASQRRFIQESLVTSTIKWIEANIAVQSSSDSLTIPRKCRYNRAIMMEGIEKCVQGCEVEQFCGSHSISDTHLGECKKMFGVSNQVAGAGVSEQFLLYVSVADCEEVDPANSAVRGKFCESKPNESGRPVHGWMRFCSKEVELREYELLVHKTLQRMLQILAFDRSLISKFVDSDGNKYLETVKQIKRDYDTSDGAIIKYLDYIVLPSVVKEVKAHFGCNGVPGAQLESETSVNDADHIYLEKLFFGNELMTAALEGRGVVSRITRAVLQDSGWYDVSLDFTEPLTWGHNAGCSFALKFCYEQLSEYRDDSVFCTTHSSQSCTADHRGYGTCNIAQVSGNVPKEYQNFDKNGEGGEDVFADRCPYYPSEVLCHDFTHHPRNLNYYGEEYAGFARCLNFVGEWVSEQVKNFFAALPKQSGCYPVECGTDTYTVRVNKEKYTCMNAGDTLAVQSDIFGVTFNGTLSCPAHSVICGSNQECGKGCHGNGKCVLSQGQEECLCYPGYHGDECDRTYNSNYCSLTPCQNGATCIEDNTGTFRCECSSGRTGVFCHLSSSCTAASCHNGARCEDRAGHVSCLCAPGYSGDLCQNELDECQDNPCQNKARCYLDPNSNLGFTCACPITYEGDYCETVKNCEIFGPLACLNGGNCISVPQAEGSYVCACPDNYIGNFCDMELCSERTCHKQGDCNFDGDYLRCSCYKGFTGDRCETELDTPPSYLDQCALLGRCDIHDGVRLCRYGWAGADCMSEDNCNNNSCNPMNTAMCHHLPRTFECECLPGFRGKYCEESSPTKASYSTSSENLVTSPTSEPGCHQNPCQNGGQCSSSIDSFICTCLPQWTGITCEEEADICDVLSCQNGGQCDRITRTCDCPIGYGGMRCERQESHCYAEPCDNDGQCVYDAAQHTFTCTCPLGFLGDTCSEVMENSCELNNACEHDTPCKGSLDDYTCTCPEGLSGDYCQINPDECEGNPCQAIIFSACRDLVNGYECGCMSGFEKKEGQCVDVNECPNDPCNNGICINLPGRYRCMCKAGWKGIHCDINFDECAKGAATCQNGATCIDLVADYQCQCVDGYKGEFCELPPEPCDSNPCQQGAPCNNVDSTQFHCTCPSGFVGERCETNYDECEADPCSEHGRCLDGVNSRTCLCDVGYDGWSCSIYIGNCQDGKSPCLNGAECEDLENKQYTCHCNDFFTGDLCEKNIDDCVGSPCQNGGVCSDGLGTFSCECPVTWTGDTCQEDVNECEIIAPCQNEAQCRNYQGGFECECKDGFEGVICEENTDDCETHECANGGVCLDEIAGYTCQCPETHKGARCEVEIQQCSPTSCLHDGVCSVVDNVIQCDCFDTGFEGPLCETEIDECEAITCQHGGTCINKVKGFVCECPCAFTGPLCQHEVDFCVDNECSEHIYMCISVANSCDYKCQCKDGWDGPLCLTNVDDCAHSPCAHGTCTDQIAGYICTCDEGYEGNDCDVSLDKCEEEPCLNGGSCQTVVEEGVHMFECTCSAQHHGARCENEHPPCYITPCGQHGICSPQDGEEVCVCEEGFEGKWCEVNTDDCAGDPCKNRGTCLDKVADFQCTCTPGYGGRTCEGLRDPCTTRDLCNNGTCAECAAPDCLERYTCTCAAGFTGSTCNVNIDECSMSPCEHGTCVDGINDYHCECDLGYQGALCDVEIDECAAEPCYYDNECVDLVGSYQCQCVGYTGLNCEEDIDECQAGLDECQNGGVCRNTLGTYQCDCPQGFGGSLCERVVLPCDIEPCFNLGQCDNVGVVEYECQCVGGYTGVRCELPSELCTHNQCIHGTCIDNQGVVTCLCDTGFMGQHCQLELCREGICQNSGTCHNTRQGFQCSCPLPWVGKTCQKKASVLQFRSSSRATVPKTSDSQVKVRIGLKLRDMVSEQQVLEQMTQAGQLLLKVEESHISVSLGNTILKIPVTSRFVEVSVILSEHYLELVVGNQTEVSLFSEPRDVNPSSDLQFGAVSLSAKREAVTSFTGCLVDIGDLDIVNTAQGEGFEECGEGDQFEELDVEEERGECSNGGVRVGPFCQCLPGYTGSQCEVEEGCAQCAGQCRQTSRGAQCVCQWPNDGALCDRLTTIPSFRADSSLLFSEDKYKKLNQSHYEITLEINPEFPRGFIAGFFGSNGHCTLTLDGILTFACFSETLSSISHPTRVELDSWTLVEIHVFGDEVSMSVNKEMHLSHLLLSSISLDGDIILGSLTQEQEVQLETSNPTALDMPGFFGEIHVMTLNMEVVNMGDSVSYKIVAAQSRDTSFTSQCATNPCGEDNTCLERAVGYMCLCGTTSGPTCSDPPTLLTMYGGVTSHAILNAQFKDSNELKVRFNSVDGKGILLYVASRYKEGIVPAYFALLSLDQGQVVGTVFLKQLNRVHNVTVPLRDPSEWHTVILTISAQRVSLQLNHLTSDIVSTTKLSASIDPLFSKSSVVVGGVKDSTPINYLLNTFGVQLPDRGMFGHVSEVYLNGVSLIDSISLLSQATTGGKAPPCAVNPCNDGTCFGNGQCTCNSGFKSGDFCDETLTFEPIKIVDGFVVYSKQFDVGTEIEVVFTGEKGAILYIRPVFQEDEGEVLHIPLHGLLLNKENTFHTITVQRKMRSVAVLSGEELIQEVDYSSTVRLPKRFYIGHPSDPFTGTLLSVRVDGKQVEAEGGLGVSQGLYPPCYNHSCLNGAVCQETSSTTYTCSCSAGFTGQYCNELIDMCQPFPCNDTSRCFSVDGVSHLCNPCPSGYKGTQCEEKAFCETLQPCSHGNITGTCTETDDAFLCECGDGKQRKDCDLSKTCSTVKCHNFGQCVELEDDFQCECPDEFVGRYCEVPVNNCAPDSCLNGGTCVSVFYDKKFFCLCERGYSGEQCQVEEDMCSSKPCHNGGICSTVGGMFSCECSAPYYGHQCLQSPCDGHACNQGNCVLLNNTLPHCECNEGFTGEFCNEDINECMTSHSCSRGQGVCRNTIGNYSCECYQGFQGRDCQTNIDDCTPDPCNGHGLCMDGFHKFTCLCQALYAGDTCSELSDKCAAQPCHNGAQCYNYGVDYFCICPPGYEGNNCSVKSDECARHRCQEGECVDHVNGYTCDCRPGFQGVFCESDLDECLEEPCLNGGLCTNTRGSYSCSCPTFYSGAQCQVALGECHDSPCLNGGECVELGVPGEGRECRCLEGWTGPECEDHSVECQVNPCQNSGICKVGEEGYYCECVYPHTGANCGHVISVPHLTSPHSLITVPFSSSEPLSLRFRPLKSGYLFQLVSNEGHQVNGMYTEGDALALDSTVKGRRHAFLSSGKVRHSEWNSLEIVPHSGGSLTLTLNLVSDTVTGPLYPTYIHLGDSARTNSFVGCVFGVEGVAAGDVSQCQEAGNTCVRGESGVCGSGGQCDKEGHCNCALGHTGQYCEERSVVSSPMFGGTEPGYLLLSDIPRQITMGVRGSGPLLIGFNTQGDTVVRVDLDSTSLQLVGLTEELVYVKGYHGTWLDVTLTLEPDFVEVRLGSGEVLLTGMSRDLHRVYLGGAPHHPQSLRGCLTDVMVDERPADYLQTEGVFECSMKGCSRQGLCGKAQCVSHGPRHHSCLCGRQFIGPKCGILLDNHAPRFQGNSYMKLEKPVLSGGGDLVISVVFKAEHKSGILFSTEQISAAVDFLSVRLVRGRAVLRYDLGAGPTVLKCPRRVDDGKWHFLHVTLRGAHAVLLLDRWASEVVSSGQRNVLNVGTHVFLGGSPTEPGAGMRGCVESISLWDTPLSLGASVESSNIVFCEDNVPANSIYNL